MHSAPHAAYVTAAYLISGGVLAALVTETLLRARFWKRRSGGTDGSGRS